MYQTSKNVLFVYGLLLIDLLVNITDNLLPSRGKQNYYLLVQALPNGARSFRRMSIISSFAFATILIQILAIICVVISLALRFFDVADRIRQAAWLVLRKRNSSENQNGQTNGLELIDSNEINRGSYQNGSLNVVPMPQRTALKLVLDRYWWSLVVGLTYLVLTIILQINKINSQRWPMSGLIETSASVAHRPGESLLIGTQTPRAVHIVQDLNEEAQLAQVPPGLGALNDGNMTTILLVLIHKLMSTCYYVSFVVVYRASPVQMVNRILFVTDKQLAAGKSR